MFVKGIFIADLGGSEGSAPYAYSRKEYRMEADAKDVELSESCFESGIRFCQLFELFSYLHVNRMFSAIGSTYYSVRDFIQN